VKAELWYTDVHENQNSGRNKNTLKFRASPRQIFVNSTIISVESYCN